MCKMCSTVHTQGAFDLNIFRHDDLPVGRCNLEKAYGSKDSKWHPYFFVNGSSIVADCYAPPYLTIICNKST